MVLVEHKMKLVMGISDRITVLHQGRCWPRARPSEIRANDGACSETYLGASGAS